MAKRQALSGPGAQMGPVARHRQRLLLARVLGLEASSTWDDGSGATASCTYVLRMERQGVAMRESTHPFCGGCTHIFTADGQLWSSSELGGSTLFVGEASFLV
jgi:hypothetical protein